MFQSSGLASRLPARETLGSGLLAVLELLLQSSSAFEAGAVMRCFLAAALLLGELAEALGAVPRELPSPLRAPANPPLAPQCSLAQDPRAQKRDGAARPPLAARAAGAATAVAQAAAAGSVPAPGVSDLITGAALKSGLPQWRGSTWTFSGYRGERVGGPGGAGVPLRPHLSWCAPSRADPAAPLPPALSQRAALPCPAPSRHSTSQSMGRSGTAPLMTQKR